MTKIYAIAIIILCLLVIVLITQPVHILQLPHIYHTKREIQTLAKNSAALKKRITAIQQRAAGAWTDGRVGFTTDGYVFLYDLHDTHGAEIIGDVNIFYLPDEKRFIISRKHYCVDLGRANHQPKNKADLLPRFDGGM